MATGDNPLEVLFPLKGVDVSTEFELQPELTTPVGINVRAYEPVTGRGRGGTRPGLSKYIAGQIPEGAELIQHLNIVVDPTVLALISTFNDFDPTGGQDDPSTDNGPIPRQPTPKRRVRIGGSGIQPNRHIGKDHQPTVPPWPPPPPPPPPTTGDIVTITYTLNPTFQNDFGGNVSVPPGLCECSVFPDANLVVFSDLGGTNEPITRTQMEDTSYISGRVEAVTGFMNAVTGFTRTVDGTCDCD